MAPRKISDEQFEKICQTLETFTTGLQAALQTSVTTALQMVLRDNHNNRDHQEARHQHQPRQYALQETSDEEDMVDNLFADQRDEHQGRRINQPNEQYNVCGGELDHRQQFPNRWESSFRSNITEFHGTLNPEDFIDWLNTVEEILEFRQVPDDVRVSLVATQFKGRAMAWWQKLKESRRQDNKPRINTWDRLVKHMRRGFLPFNYERTLYNKLQNLRQGSRSVDEYATKFFQMTARMTSGETEKQLISRFIGGLRLQLQVALAQFNPLSVLEAHQHAIYMELQLRSSWTSSTRSHPQNTLMTDNNAQTNAEASSSRPESTKVVNNDTIASSRPARTNALRCYSCLHS